jgi:lipopolysaccharide export system protein LptA
MKKHFYSVTLFALLVFSFSVITSRAVHALGADGVTKDEPIEVSADKELEWDRAAQTYIARGSAKALQGVNSLAGDVLKAYYSKDANATTNSNEEGSTDIYKIESFGSVVIKSDGNTAYADKGVYDLRSGEAVLTGRNLRLLTANEIVTSRDQITFNSLTNIMTADGNAKIVQGTDTLEANQFIAYFKDVNGERVLDRMEAIGNVVITTPEEVLTGNRGRYVADTNIATVNGDVKITRGQNVLTGDRGQVNFNTRKSKLFGGASAANTSSGSSNEPKQRVKAIFHPE